MGMEAGPSRSEGGQGDDAADEDDDDEWAEGEESVTASLTLSQITALTASDEHSLQAAKAVGAVRLRTKKARPPAGLSPLYLLGLAMAAVAVGVIAFAAVRLMQ